IASLHDHFNQYLNFKKIHSKNVSIFALTSTEYDQLSLIDDFTRREIKNHTVLSLSPKYSSFDKLFFKEKFDPFASEGKFFLKTFTSVNDYKNRWHKGNNKLKNNLLKKHILKSVLA